MLGSTDIKISDNFFLSLNCSELARVSSLLEIKNKRHSTYKQYTITNITARQVGIERDIPSLTKTMDLIIEKGRLS